jgi:phage terminase large subunit-like protein
LEAKKRGEKKTEQNSTVYQAETTLMCTVNRSAWMHHIVSRLINFNEAATL